MTKVSPHIRERFEPLAPAAGLSDAAFVNAVESCTLPSDAFRHSDHIRLAWIYLRDPAFDRATERMVESIRRFALHHTGDTTKYHDTLTRLWMRLVAQAMTAFGAQDDFAAFAAANPLLFDKRRAFDFYSEQRLFSQAARSGWVEPDILPLPDGPASRPLDSVHP